MLEALITASPKFINRLAPAEQRLYFERGADFLFRRIGKEHVISAVVHMDETTPHMHLCFCPITEDGRLSASAVIGKWRTGLLQWQDAFYKHMHAYYPALERGLPASMTGRKHIPPELIRRMDNVWKCINTVNEQLSGVTFWNAHKRRDDCIRLLGENLYDVYLLKAHVDEIDSTVSKQEESIKEKDMKIDKLSNHLEETEIALIVAQTKTSQLEEEKDSMLELLEYVPPEKRSRFEHKKSAER